MQEETGNSDNVVERMTQGPLVGGLGASEGQSPRFALLTDLAWALALALVFTWITNADDSRLEPIRSWAGFQSKLRLTASMRLVLNWLAFVPVLLILLRAWLDSTFKLRRSSTLILMGAMAAWSAISLAWSCDRFDGLILVGSSFGVFAVAWTLTQTGNTRSSRLMGLAAISGLLAAILVGLAAEAAYLHPKRMDTWIASRESILAARGLATSSREAIQMDLNNVRFEFEEPFMSSNPLASAALICTLCSAALLAGFLRARNWRQTIWAGLITAAALCWLFAGRSKTVSMLFIASLAFLCLWPFLRTRWSVRGLAAAFGLVLAAAIAAVIAIGSIRGDLFTASFSGRWVYWVEYVRAACHHALTGIGTGSFRWFAPEYVPAQTLEQAKDEHNFFIKSFLELGIVGLALAIAWTASLFRDCAAGLVSPPAQQPDGSRRTRPLILAVVIAAAIGIALRFSVNLTDPLDSIGVLLLELAAFLTVALVLSRPGGLSLPAGSQWLLAAAVLVFALSGQMDMQFADNRAIMLFALALGLLVSSYSTELHLSASQLRQRLAVAALLAAGLAIPSAWVLIAERHARLAAMADLGHEPFLAASHLAQAQKASGRFADVKYPLTRAAIMASRDGGFGQAMEAWLDALTLNPREVTGRLQLAIEFEKRGQLDAAKTLYEDALRLEPRNVVIHAAYASFAEAHHMPDIAKTHWEITLTLVQDASTYISNFYEPWRYFPLTKSRKYAMIMARAKNSLYSPRPD